MTVLGFGNSSLEEPRRIERSSGSERGNLIEGASHRNVAGGGFEYVATRDGIGIQLELRSLKRGDVNHYKLFVGPVVDFVIPNVGSLEQKQVSYPVSQVYGMASTISRLVELDNDKLYDLVRGANIKCWGSSVALAREHEDRLRNHLRSLRNLRCVEDDLFSSGRLKIERGVVIYDGA
ncbi:hypothetical protein J4216_00515 [Candidatus Woesearchaeota archaeon]|nr:hypothetical protein [Candidatus Woesearchaeota archaeon]